MSQFGSFSIGYDRNLTASDSEGDKLILSFKSTVNGEILAKTAHHRDSFSSTIEVLCRRLLILHKADEDRGRGQKEKRAPVAEPPTNEPQHPGDLLKKPKTPPNDWLLYIHSDLAFFSFGHQHLEFGAAFRKTPKVGG